MHGVIFWTDVRMVFDKGGEGVFLLEEEVVIMSIQLL